MEHDTNVRIIGVTGGVGSGKSAVMDILERKYGAKIILADLVSHELMTPGAANYEAVVREFGTGILMSDSDDHQDEEDFRGGDEVRKEDGKRPVDRKKLGSIVFSDQAKLEKLNQITHQGVAAEIRDRIKTWISQRQSPETKILIAVEAALLIGSPLEADLDSLWYVYVNDRERIRRLQESRGYTEEYARAILSRQLSDEAFRKKCHEFIDNSGDLMETEKQIRRLLEKDGFDTLMNHQKEV